MTEETIQETTEAETPEPTASETDDGIIGAPAEVPDEKAIGFSDGEKYDFSRPWTMTGKFHQNLVSIADNFAGQLSLSLSNALRSNVEVNRGQIRQVLFNDFLGDLDGNQSIGVFSFEPLKGQSLVTMDSKTMFRLLDKLIGGAGEYYEIDREFTDLELRIFRYILGRILSDLGDSFKKYFVAQPVLSRVESNPAFVAVIAPGEKVIQVSTEVRFGDDIGSLVLAFPTAGFDPVMDSLDPDDEAMIGPTMVAPEDVVKVRAALLDSSVEVEAQIGKAPIPLSRLLELEVGDTIILDRKINEPVPLKVGNITLCWAEPGKSQSRRAVRVCRKEETRDR